MKRVAFVGNMNNMPYMFAKKMWEKEDVDIILYVDMPAEYKLDRPEAYDSSISYPYPDWIKEIKGSQSSNFRKLLLPPVFYRNLINELNGCDTVILNGIWMVLAPYLNKKITIYALCAGYEIDTLSDYRNIKTLARATVDKRRFLKLFKPLLQLFYRIKIFQQRRGIHWSDGINYYPSGISPRGDELIQEMMGDKPYRKLELRGFIPDELEYVEPQVNKSKFTILNFTRFYFLNDQIENKRNDIMLEGIGLFLKEIDFKPDVEILLFSKGDPPSLTKAKEIIDSLNYSDYVKWLGEVPQDELFNKIVPECDVAFDQLGNQWIGAGAFVMMMGRPLIANGRPEVFEPLTGETPPVCQATTPEEVCFWLKKLYEDRSQVKLIGLESRNYVQKYYSMSKTVNFFLDKD